jgi:hypothetical protein
MLIIKTMLKDMLLDELKHVNVQQLCQIQFRDWFLEVIYQNDSLYLNP